MWQNVTDKGLKIFYSFKRRLLTGKEQQFGAFDPTLKCSLHEGREPLIVDGVDLDAADLGQEEADNLDVTSLELHFTEQLLLQQFQKDRPFSSIVIELS